MGSARVARRLAVRAGGRGHRGGDGASADFGFFQAGPTRSDVLHPLDCRDHVDGAEDRPPAVAGLLHERAALQPALGAVGRAVAAKAAANDIEPEQLEPVLDADETQRSGRRWAGRAGRRAGSGPGRAPHRLIGLKQVTTMRPSGISTRETSRSTSCGSSENSRMWGRVTRSMLWVSKRQFVEAAQQLAGIRMGVARAVGGRRGRQAPVPRTACGSRAACRWRGGPSARRGSRRCPPRPGRTGATPIPARIGRAARRAPFFPIYNRSVGHRALMLKVEPIPAFQDNYIWAIHDGHSAAIVDPGEAAPVARFLAERGLALGAIVITHHHGDHQGGVADLLAAHPEGARWRPGAGGRPGRRAYRPPHPGGARGRHGDAAPSGRQLPRDRRTRRIPPAMWPMRATCPAPARWCSAATPSSPAAAGGCSRAPRRKCWPRWTSWPRCRATPASIAPTSTRAAMYALRRPWSRPTRTSPPRAARVDALREAGTPNRADHRGARARGQSFLRSREPQVRRAVAAQGADIEYRRGGFRRAARLEGQLPLSGAQAPR